MERDKKIDVLKGIAIYLVVMGHVIAWFFKDFSANSDLLPTNTMALWNFIYSFHMPLFVFLSGYVFMNPQKRYSFKHIAKRCVTYMIPFTTMGVLLYCWRGGKLDNYWYFRSLVEFSLLLFAIYAGATKFSPLGRFTPPICIILFLVIIWALSHIIKRYVWLDMLLDTQHIMLGVFFIIGWAYRMYKSIADKILVNQYVLLISVLLVFGGVVYNINIPYLKAMVSIMLALNVANVLVGKFDCRYLEAIGKETMGIYIFHFFFTFKLFVIGTFLCEISNEGLSTSIVVQLALVLPISFVIVKCCMYIINFLKMRSAMAIFCLGDLRTIKK